MSSSGVLRRVTLVRTDVSEELSASFIRVTRIGELGTTLALTSNRRTLRDQMSDRQHQLVAFLQTSGLFRGHNCRHFVPPSKHRLIMKCRAEHIAQKECLATRI
jgi:hypothetical protein